MWRAGDEAVEMGLLISGNLKAVILTRKQNDMRTLQIIVPGSVVGELGLLSGGCHSRTLVATKPCEVSDVISPLFLLCLGRYNIKGNAKRH